MADKYQKPALKALDFIYSFEGGLEASGRVATKQDITLVHDVARNAGLAAAIGPDFGFVRVGMDMAHVATGIRFNTVVDIYSIVQNSFEFVPQQDLWVWLMRVGCTSTDAADFASAQAGVGDANDGTKTLTMVARWDAMIDPLIVTSNEMAFRADAPPLILPLPMLLRPGDDLVVSSVADNAGTVTVTVNMELWVGPRFVNCPGT